jgi:hypothetical protein
MKMQMRATMHSKLSTMKMQMRVTMLTMVALLPLLNMVALLRFRLGVVSQIFVPRSESWCCLMVIRSLIMANAAAAADFELSSRIWLFATV